MRADDDAPLVVGQSLGAACRIAAHHAHRQLLGNILGDGQQLWHRFEGHAAVVLVEPSHDDSKAAVGEPLAHRHGARAKELDLVDAHHLRVGQDQPGQLLDVVERRALEPLVAVADNRGISVAPVEARLEDLHPLLAEQGALEATDQLFGLAREHGPADDLDPAGILGQMLHGRKRRILHSAAADEKPTVAGARSPPARAGVLA